MSDTPSIRRWVYDPGTPMPDWVRLDIRFENCDRPRIGDTICMATESGRYWVENTPLSPDRRAK